MPYYHDLITAKSWQVLQNLRRKFNFILIGGWAVFLYSQVLKSKDIDLVVGHEELEKLKGEFEVYKNDRLKKYEARVDDVEIDIYVPFYSNPGLPAEELDKNTQSLEGFQVPEKEILAVLKGKALQERFGSPKGRKDLIDLISLFQIADFSWQKFNEITDSYGLKNNLFFLKKVIAQTTNIPELDLNVHKMARFKKRILPLMSLKKN